MMVSKATYMCSFHGLKERCCFFSTCAASLQQHCGGPGLSPAGGLLLWGQAGAGGLHGTGNKLPASVNLLWCGVGGLRGTGNKLPASVSLLWCGVRGLHGTGNKLPASVNLLWCGAGGLHGTGNKLPASVNLLWCVVWREGPTWNR